MADLHATAARIGAHHWLEQSVWRLLGGWAAAEGHAGAAVLFDVHAQHAAWRAAQWWDRLPVLAGVDRAALAAPATPGLGALVGALDGPAAPASTLGRAAAAYRVLLPRLVVAYRAEGPRLSPVSDGPALRTLGQVASDAAADWQAGEALVQRLVVDGAGADEAATTVAGLERLAAGHPAGEAVE